MAECQMLGGFNKGPGVCSPNPRGDLPPSDGHGVCCLPNANGDQVECEDRTASDCLAGGGVAKSASGVCEIDTCADFVPPNPDVMCCVPKPLSGDAECEDVPLSRCLADGGSSLGKGTCPDVDPCVAAASGGSGKK